MKRLLTVLFFALSLVGSAVAPAVVSDAPIAFADDDGGGDS